MEGPYSYRADKAVLPASRTVEEAVESVPFRRDQLTVDSESLSKEFLKGFRKAQESGSAVVKDDSQRGPGRLLLAFSSAATRDRLKAQLSEYEITVANDGPEALASRDLHQVDAILVDEALPPWGGPELCRRLQSDLSLAAVPVAIALSRESADGVEGALEAGAHEVLVKPFLPAEIRVRVRNLVQRRRSFKELETKNKILNEALSDLCESEAMLVQAEKLSVLGEMSAGIVHEINNPLNYSKTAMFVLQTLVKDLEGEMREEFEDVVGDISEGMERVGRIVRDLRAFATKGPIKTVELNLVSVVRTARRLLGDRLGTIRYMEDVPEELRVLGNENQLCQVALNILKNGVEATEMAGRSLDEAEVKVWAEEVGPHVELHFRDNGCGIPEADQARIFEPFFSRKSAGKGMGLGLSICGRILDEHNSEISIKSEAGKYTQFTIKFPQEDWGEQSKEWNG